MDTWTPTLAVSTESDTDAQARENRQFELEHKDEYDECMKRKREYQEIRFKAYTEIWERCNKAMQSSIQARKNHEYDIYNNLIKLLEVVKEYTLTYEENRYEMCIIFNALRAYLNCHQKEKE